MRKTKRGKMPRSGIFAIARVQFDEFEDPKKDEREVLARYLPFFRRNTLADLRWNFFQSLGIAELSDAASALSLRKYRVF
jgi:uncharacterized caspase-like protein